MTKPLAIMMTPKDTIQVYSLVVDGYNFVWGPGGDYQLKDGQRLVLSFAKHQISLTIEEIPECAPSPPQA